MWGGGCRGRVCSAAGSASAGGDVGGGGGDGVTDGVTDNVADGCCSLMMVFWDCGADGWCWCC